jgi:nitrite reductase/ring-hydroxylating ferredoxin subunit
MEERAVYRCTDVTAEKVLIAEVGNRSWFAPCRQRPHRFENVCAHQGGPVCDGEVLSPVEAVLDDQKRVVHDRFAGHQRILICPWHGYSFDVVRGEYITDRKILLQQREARERDGLVYAVGGPKSVEHRGAETLDAR